MAQCDRYIMYKQRRRVIGSSTWEDVVPAVYSYNGDGTMPLVIAQATDNTNCCPEGGGGGPSVGDIVWRENGTVCDGTTKRKQLQKYQWNGSAWMPLQEYQSGDVIEYNSTDCGYTPTPSTDYENQYFSIYLSNSGTITYQGNTALTTNQLSYSTNGTTWSTPSSSFTVSVGDYQNVYFKGNCAGGYVNGNYQGLGTFSTDKMATAQGNIMSLLYGDSYQGNRSMSGKESAFKGLFSGSTTLANAANLVMPTTLAPNACESMFSGCTSLTTVPSLPATAMTVACYSYMFRGCTSLQAAPQLPATSLAMSCYDSMFDGCTSLIIAPQLPATTLASYCYYFMFANCTSLTTAPALPATALTVYCYNAMFQGCTSLTTAPTLPATTLAERCYRYMFRNCSNLNSITCLATDLSASDSTYYWTQGVSSSGTFKKAASMTGWTTGNNGIPSGWSVTNA